jgi:TolB-like protein
MTPSPVSPPHYRFGVYEVDFRTGELRKSGARIRIQTQPLSVLASLLERPGELVTRDELRFRLWTQDTFVDFEHGLNAAMTRLRQALGDHAAAPRYVETLSRTGYRFIAPVIRFPLPVLRVEAESPPGSIGVLPLSNLSSDPDCDFFGDGLIEEITHALTRVRGLRVVARTSVFQVQRRRQDVRAIGAQLGVRTILEGSVRKYGNQIRVTMQLIDVKDGYHLWSEVFEREMIDLFAIQDEIARFVVEALRVHVA